VNKSLYTQKEIKEFRDKKVKDQKGIDPILGTKFPEGSICQDHSHETQHCRAALHLQTNAFEGLVFNAYKRCLKWLTDVPLPELLRNLASYLEEDYSDNPYHTGWIKAVKVEFNKLSSSQMKQVLQHFNKPEGKNLQERKKLFNEIVLDRSYGFCYIRDVINQVKE
jgi:hypothetical protein